MAISHLPSPIKSMAINTEGATDAVAWTLDRTGAIRERSGSDRLEPRAFITGRYSVKRNGTATMFGSLKALVSSLVEDARLKNRVENEDGRLATAALLIRVATVDSEMSQARRGRLHAVLKSSFGLDDLTTFQLIDDAAAAERSAIDLYHFTRQLNDFLDDDGRRRIVKMMWEIIYVDGGANEFESNIIWRAADLLGVTSRQRIALRQRTAADGVALAAVDLPMLPSR
jgi:uncharacterized tellurite resistance protein B-like protein